MTVNVVFAYTSVAWYLKVDREELGNLQIYEPLINHIYWLINIQLNALLGNWWTIDLCASFRC